MGGREDKKFSRSFPNWENENYEKNYLDMR